MKKRIYLLFFPITLLLLFSLTSCQKNDAKAQQAAEEKALDSVSAMMEGTVSGITGEKISIKTSDGTAYTFNMTNAELQCDSGIIPGNHVQLIYVGALSGTDTTKVRLRKIITDDDNKGLIAQKESETKKAAQNAEEQQNKTNKPGYALPVSGVKVEENEQSIVANYSLNVRADADDSASILGSLSKGETASQTGICENGWRRIAFDGQTGYVWGDLVE